MNLKTVTLAALLSLACTTKVSEWVLLNSPPDRYLLHCRSNGKMPQQDNKVLEKQFKMANVTTRNELDPALAKPVFSLFYNDRLFAEFPDMESLKGLESSPVRDRIAGELMQGKLCVMLYLRSGNREKDEAGLATLRTAMASSPFGKIIQVNELDRNDAAEKHFVNMLLNVESDLSTIREPMLFGVFGRFRVLEPLVAKGITTENINLMVDFFTADCSCVIKDDLPGISILYRGSWENPGPALVNPILDSNPNLEHH